MNKIKKSTKIVVIVGCLVLIISVTLAVCFNGDTDTSGSQSTKGTNSTQTNVDKEQKPAIRESEINKPELEGVQTVGDQEKKPEISEDERKKKD